MAKLERPRAQPVGQRPVVRREDDRPCVHCAREQVGGVGAKACVGLVEDEEARVVQNGAPDRKALLLRLVEEGHDHLAGADRQAAAEERLERARAALKRIPSLLDAELLLSDRAWT